MAVSTDTVTRFEQEIKLRSFDDRYIGADEEKELLRIAIQFGIDIDDALQIISNFGTRYGIVVERAIENACKDVLKQFAADGRVDKREFDDAVSIYMTKTSGRVSEPDVRKRLKRIMLENRWTAKEGGLFGTKWFSAIPA